uniref:Uncharacterized protein n=1 Tax=Plectus sambesii TaxID=2011161 RepID=A0A914UYF4_9BILA
MSHAIPPSIEMPDAFYYKSVMFLTAPFVLAILLNAIPISLQEPRKDADERDSGYERGVLRRPNKAKPLPVLHETELQCWEECLINCQKSSYANMTLWLCQFPTPPIHLRAKQSAGGQAALIILATVICMIIICVAVLAVLVCIATTYRRVNRRGSLNISSKCDHVSQRLSSV